MLQGYEEIFKYLRATRLRQGRMAKTGPSTSSVREEGEELQEQEREEIYHVSRFSLTDM